ncbi:MAG TPA: GNAT family N-acetyltransferase [Acidimicrobiales bacterium]|nr:GNAT family N-acetyltransferase [Acidimicrobiales bacterium]
MIEGRVAAEIDGMRRALGAQSLQRIAPHVTLVPPVNVPADEAGEALEVLRAAGAACRPIRASLGPMATFWPVNPVLYLAVAGDVEEIEQLRAGLLKGPLAPPPGRKDHPFVPHATIDQRIDPESIESALSTLSGYEASVTFERVTLLEQDSEHVWHAIADAPLGAPAVVGRGGLEVELSVSERPDPGTARSAAEEWAQYSVAQYGPETSPDMPFAITARREGAVVGLAEGDSRGRVLVLSRLIVWAGARGEGVGGHLLRATERLALERGCDRVRVLTIAGGRAEWFYSERGYFRVGGVLPAWRGEKDFVMLERSVSA